MIIALLNRKGGVSKTTSAAYIAACLHASGRTVTGIDTDPNKSFFNWSNTTELPFQVLLSSKAELSSQLAELKGDAVIDTPPNDGEIIYKVAMLADEVVIPISPTQQDINQLQDTLSTVAEVEAARGIDLTSVLMTRWKQRENLGQEIESLLKEEGVAVCDNKVRNLNVYQVMESPHYLEEYQAFLSEIGVL